MNPFDMMVIFTLFMCGGLLLFLTIRNRERIAFQFRLYTIAALLRFLGSIAIYQFGLVSVLGDEDSSGWWGGVVLQDQWNLRHTSFYQLPLEMLHSFDGHHLGYQYIVGVLLYFASQPERLIAAAFNCMVGALTVVIAYRIASQLYSQWVATRVAWFSCFAPSLIVWSAQTVKEPTVILLESLVVYGCVVLKIKGFSMRHFILCLVASTLLIPFRFYAAYISLIAVIVTMAIPELSKRRTRFTVALLLIGVGIAVLYASGTLVSAEAQLDKFDLKYVHMFRDAVATGGSGVKLNFDIQTPSGFALGIVVGFAHLMLAPFPWQLGGASLRMLLTLPELLVWWWFFFVGVVPGMLRIKAEFSKLLPLLLVTGGMAALYSVLFGNVGLAYRQRGQLLPWLLIIGMRGLELKRLEKEERTRVTALQVARLRFARDLREIPQPSGSRPRA